MKNYKTFLNKYSININNKKQININEEINKDNYHYIIEHLLPNIIRKHTNKKIISESLVKSYSNKILTKEFNADKVIFETRKLNKLDIMVDNKIDYILEDNSVVAISYDTQEIINNILKEHTDIIEYMKKNINNFCNTINQIKGYY